MSLSSQITAGFQAAGAALKSLRLSLKPVAFSGSYNDLSDKPAAGGSGSGTLAASITDFANNPATTTSLYYGYKAGNVQNGAVAQTLPAGQLWLDAGQMNYIEILNGAVVSNVVGFSKNGRALATAVAGTSSIGTITDCRALFSNVVPLPLVQVASDFSMDFSNTYSLNFGYLGGTLRKDNAVTVVANGSVTLAPNATNFIELSDTGAVSANVNGFTAGKYPMAQVTTTGSINRALVIDKRSSVSFGGGGSAASTVEPVSGIFSGAFSGPLAGTLKHYPGQATTYTKMTYWLNSVSGTVQFAIKKNGVSAATGSVSSTALVSGTINLALTSTDYLTIDIVSGSGSDLTIRLE